MSHVPVSQPSVVQLPDQRHYRSLNQANQRGVALVVALILLLVITLVGLAAVRGTIMQQKMASNMYDRQIAFQSAEAAMRAATANLAADSFRNCQSASVICLSNPFNETLPTGSIHDVAGGTAVGQYTASTLAFGQPQYVVENMGNWVNPNANMGFGQNAGAHNYMPSSGGSPTSVYYRVTARSGDPAVVGDRAVVTLQAMIKQG